MLRLGGGLCGNGCDRITLGNRESGIGNRESGTVTETLFPG
ncbi:hypothetical protein [Moorena sp. SIO3I6]|nr:hypothetical protein [Moorena sp. SIO3I6]